MKIKYIIAAVSCMMLLPSCYEDKGNYDYMPMNDIDITVTAEKRSFVLGDVVKIEPEMHFALDKATPDAELEYKWTYDSKLIGEERMLNWTADMIASNKDLRLAVYDKNTGVTYYGSTNLSVTSPFTANGWLVLSEGEDKKTMLTYMRQSWDKDDNMECEVVRDVYGNQNGGESLGSEPVSMNVHYVGYLDGEDKTGWVWIGQKGGQGFVDVSGSSYKKEAELSGMFVGGGYPQGFTPHEVVGLKNLELAIGEDGTVYTRVKESANLYNNGSFIDTPLTWEGNNVDGRNIAMAPFSDHGGVLLYDVNSHNFFHLCDFFLEEYVYPTGYQITERYSGRLIQLKATDRVYNKVPEFTRFSEMNTVDMLYVGAYKSEDYGVMGYKTVIEKDGAFYMQDFTVGDFSDWSQPSLTPISQKELTGWAAYMDGTNQFALCRYQTNMPAILFTKGNTLYLSYLNGDNTPMAFANFNSKITSINVENNRNRYLSVGLESGDVYIFYLDNNTLQTVLGGNPIAIDQVDHKTLLWHESGLGKVIKVMFKNPQDGTWSWY